MADNVGRLRAELELLRARYDSGAVPLTVYAVIKQMECELAWQARLAEKERRGE
jgi:hypothetical protein